MSLGSNEKEIAERTSRSIKAELKRANVTYAELAKRLEEHGVSGETEASIKSRLARRTFSDAFLIGVIAALELEGVTLEDL